AYEQLVRRFQDMAVGYAYAVLGDWHLAEDVAQEAFITAYYDLPTLRMPRAFPAWFRRVLFKQVDRIRRRSALTIVPLEWAQEIATPQRDLVQLLEQRELSQQVRFAIASLPEHQRVVVALFYISAYSVIDISRFLDIPVATVKTRLHAARRRLHERMLVMIEDSLPNQRPSKDSIFTDRVMTLTFRPMDEAHARAFLSWRYQAPYDVYNVTPKHVDEAVQFFLDPQNAYYSIVTPEGQFVALCCFGWDAQVPGGDYSLDALDIGMQLRPDLIGRTHDLTNVALFVDFARQAYAATRLRTTIATFDEPDLQAYQQAGFQIAQRFDGSRDGRTYVMLIRDV
ncbi:MAG TPA: RNA polymerase sigma factor, partial [Roseiflexaceae bacterium]|nr:RNA polymerase sigma factor [Roseiflexaceae bacterium]